jgi:hypothetical protein
MKTAVLVLSRAGLDLARTLRAGDPGHVAVFGPSCVVGACGGPEPPEQPGRPAFPTAEPGVFGWVGPLRHAFPWFWTTHEEIVAVMPLDVVVRLAGPLARDKRTDPAVIVVDEAGRFAVSVLGGHGQGDGGNALAERVASRLGALPVITTATHTSRHSRVDPAGRA